MAGVTAEEAVFPDVSGICFFECTTPFETGTRGPGIYLGYGWLNVLMKTKEYILNVNNRGSSCITVIAAVQCEDV